MYTPRLILLITASLAAPLAAQESEASDAPVIDTSTIIVTGQGLPETPGTAAYSQRTIDREQIITAPSGRIEDVLGSVAGFQQFRRSDSRSSNPSAQGATLRALGGNATSRALVLLDGVPVSDPFFGFIPFTSLAPERLGAIRVTRGGGAGPFGAGALAGVIELESAGPNVISPFTGSALVNDRGGTEASASLSGDLGAGFGSASVRWDRGPGFFTTPTDQRVPATARAAYDSWSASVRGAAPLNDSVELQARGLVFEDRRTLRFEGADSSTRGADASIRLVGKGDWEFDALAYLQARNFSNVVISSTRFVKVLDQRNTPSTGLGGKFELRPPVSPDHTLRLGIDYRQSDGELQEEAFSAFTGNLRERRRAGGKNSDLGFFIEDDWTLGSLVLTGGLRLDHTRITGGFFEARDADNVLVSETRAEDRSDWSLSYRAGASFAASDQIRLRAAAYRGLRLPTLNELYRPFVVFPVVTQANAELENERLEGFEAGVDWTPSDALEFTLTAFDNRVEGAIANVTLEPNLRQRQNLPAIEARGIELGAQAALGQFSLDGTLAYTDAEVDGSGASLALEGNRPPQTPRWAGAATLAWKPAKGWVAAATLRHVGTQFESDLETGVLPAATTLGAYFQAPLFDAFALVLRGENLTGETIVTRNSNGAIDLGTPRTVWGGVRYGF
ncbi:TonB-dependent receptor plug domain-containing protein [Erythrobacter sp. W53]|uniref:TonB-dependent receptor plug domain-containing protein n=1 Tax=Erythrobacter sp. W53 TaxID=3425947 RepID=UPI003D767A8D